MNQRTILDISPKLSIKTGVFPGDTALSRTILLDTAKGDAITLSSLNTTVHVGAHADAPNHYATPQDAGYRDIAAQPLERYLGPCHVLDAAAKRGGRVGVDDVRGLESIRHPRVLIRTGSFPEPDRWNADFAGVTPELVHALADRGVFTIGIDTPSVDTQDSKDMPAHKAVLARDMAIIEGLVLADVAPGEYELIALPLKLEGFDASPVRAVLRPLFQI